MYSILTVAAPVSRPRFATIERLKAELSIEGEASDILLGPKIEEASADIELALGFRVPREDVVETFRHDDPLEQWFSGSSSGNRAVWVAEPLLLRRKAVAAITSVVLDDDTLDPAEYVLDPERDALIRLDTSGNTCAWLFSKSIVVTYSAGYLLPNDSSPNLPANIESAVIELVSQYWASKGQNPRIMSEDVPGLGSVRYWVGAVGDPGQLPPTVLAKLPRRPRMAVA